ncbi:Arc family DNA-binding protein [Metarhizobium album]|nr:Arc family DNA-binding protein [Rhizobium album]
MTVNRTNSDQFQLRLPPGLRERVKVYAERHGRSMNAEIVRILEREFPEPLPISERLAALFEVLDVLKSGATDGNIDQLVTGVEETVEDLLQGRISGIDPAAKKQLQTKWQEYLAEQAKEAASSMNLDIEEEHAFNASGTTGKYVETHDLDDDEDPRK